MNIGIFGGSFNPIHTGHLIVASYFAQWTDLDAVWLMLSPLNPFKADAQAPTAADSRLEMLQLAVDTVPRLDICTVQLSMPTPSYTIDALDTLHRLDPHDTFRCIIGSDSWADFDKWRDSDRIITDYGVMIYPRPGYPVEPATLPPGVTLIDAPRVDISSTFNRQAVAAGKDIRYFVPQQVAQYIASHNLYANTLTTDQTCHRLHSATTRWHS